MVNRPGEFRHIRGMNSFIRDHRSWARARGSGTNTGKTHYAIDACSPPRTGMISLPRVLLGARSHDRVVAVCSGVDAVAADQRGEDRSQIARLLGVRWDRYRPASGPRFLAVDEPDVRRSGTRPCLATDRLHARGSHERCLGAETMRGLIQRLVPQSLSSVSAAPVRSLAYTGAKKLTRLPPHRRVVAFQRQRGSMRSPN